MTLTAKQYRTHRSSALRGAFKRGELVGLSGESISNPYKLRNRSRRDGSWTEGCARAWALGKREGEEQRARLLAAQQEVSDADGTGREGVADETRDQ